MNLTPFLDQLAGQGIELWPDGEQLCYRAPEGSLTSHLLTTIKEHKAEILDLLTYGSETHPLSYGQKALWFEYQYAPESSAYNLSFGAHVHSAIDVPALQHTFQMLVNRHPALRTTFDSRDGKPYQRVHRYQRFILKVIDASTWSEEILNEQLIAAHETPFNLQSGPLIRVHLFTRQPTDHILVFSMHHLVSDGWSIWVMLDELNTLYPTAKAGTTPVLPPLNESYAQYITWQTEMLEANGDQLWTYWREQLAGELPVLNLPTDHPRTPIRANQGASVSINVPIDVTRKLRELARREGVTLYMLILAAYQVLLHRYTDQDDILVGSTIAGRSQPEFADVVGYFTSLIVMRANLAADPTFRTFLQQVRQTVLGTLKHQDYPFPLLVEQLQPVRVSGQSPIFQAVINLQNVHRFKEVLNLFVPPADGESQIIDLGGLLLSPLEFRQYEGLFDLYLELWDHPDTLLGTIKYTPDLFDTSTMERMAGHFQTLLTNIVAENPLGVAQRISDLQLLTATERHEILVEWNHLVPHPDVNQRPDDAKDKCIQQWFEDQVERTPDAVAVVLPSPIPHQGLTYRALNARANQLAHYLQSLGVGSHLGSATPVGLCIDRSIEMVVGILGILKAGGIYVPLDRDYPKERLAFMAADTAVSVLLTRERLLDDLPKHQAHVVCLDKHWDIIALASQQNLPIAISGANTAYILYTSGSTGRPKGVTMPHVALANLIQWQLEQTKTPRPQTLQFAPISFDVSVQEIFSTLCAGGRLFLIPEETRRDSEALLGFLTYHRIERLFLPFVALQQLAEIAREQPLPTSLREVITAGEQLQITPAIASLFERLPSCILSNHYGPTESHVVTAFDLTGSVHDWPTSPPIGRPIANTQIYILDRHRQPTLVGVPGELHIGGIQLASGYHNRASLTEDKFIPNPFAPTEDSDRLYRTGDLARYRPDGNIEFLGRMDSQIKLRGFRIELGEIEHVLSQHPDVQDAIVVTRDEALEGHHTLSSDKRLVAYLVLDRASQDAQSEDELLLKIRRYLQAKLPDYMVPAAFVMIDIDALPLTPTGKVDHKALPAPAVFHRILADTFVPPRTQTEERLAAIWSEKLRVDQIGMHDDFFELGGHSLLATQVIAKMAEICSVEVPLRSLFELRTIERLAQHVLQLQQTGASETYSHAWPQVVPAPEQRYEPFPLTDVQHAYWVGRNDLFELGHVAAHIYLEIEGEGLDLQRLTETWRQLIDRHEMLRAVVRPDGQQQILADVPAYCFTVYDLSTGDSHTVQTHLASIREEMSHQVLPADTWPLFDIRATWLTGQQRRLHISLDALILDGWSLLLLFQEWLTLYQDPTRGLPPLELSFRDYVLTEPAVEETERYRRSLAYWYGRLDTLPPSPELPLARNPQSLSQPQFRRHAFQLDAEPWQLLKARAKRTGLTPSGLLLAAYAEVLSVWSKHPRFTLNLTLFNRLPLHRQVNDIVGDFTPLLLVEIDHSANESFETRALRIQKHLWDALDHRYVNGVRLLRELTRRRRTDGGSAQMPVVFTSLMALDQDIAELELFGEMVYTITQTPQVWLDHQVMEKGGTLACHWDAVEALFPQGMLDDMFDAYCTLLQRLASDDTAWNACQPARVPAAQLAQRAQVNATQAPLSNEMLHTLFLNQVDTRPEQPALITPQLTLTYRQLYERANQVGHWLRQRGIGSPGAVGARPAGLNSLVAVVMDSGWEQVAAVLGIHLAGAAYLPIDPQLPRERQHYLLAQGEVRLVLTQSWLEEKLSWPPGLERLRVDTQVGDAELAALEGVQQPTDLAYVIYTSGSTGFPKGVLIDHRGAVNTVLDINRRFSVTAHDRVLALSALNFDLSVYDLFGLLAAGGAIVMPEADLRTDPAHWLELMVRHGVTLWNTVPALMQMLVDYHGDEGAAAHRVTSALRLVMLSGDWIPVTLPDRIKRWWQGVEVYSLGGATEASIWSICYPIETVDPAWSSIPYGQPLSNQTVHVFDEHLQPRPVWVPGELYIGGTGVALGYWRDTERSRARFLVHPETGERLYRTGDLGRYRRDGQIEFLGREDFQIKLRGHRIELGEIESHLLQHPGVKETVVQAIAHPKGGKRLVAYVVLDETMQEATEQAPDAYLPTDQDGVLLDPVERLEFKLHQPGIRLFNGANPKRFCLPAPDFDATLRDAYLSRQSYRQFMEDSIPLHEFSAFLSCLRQMPVANTPLPKYRYPSAGGLYPVQTYLYIKPERVAGLAGGYYYYQPAQHELVWLSAAAEGRPYLQAGVNQPIVEAGAFCLFLIGAMDAIEPMYGEMGRDFSLLEAGYISQLLMMEAPVYQLGLCPVSAPDDTDLPIALGLTVSQPLLHSLVGGCIEPKQRTQWLVGQQKPAAVSWSVQLESHLAKKLPDYMVPSTFVAMASLPLTANGKINRQALPEPDISALRADHDFVPPRTTTEEQLAAMWVEILRLDQAGIRAEGAQPDDVGIHSNFFECGGDSLLAVQLITRVREAFAVELPVRSLFASPTIAGIAELIENTLPAQAATATQHDTALKWQRVPPHLITIQPGENKQGEKKTPFFCVHPVAGIVFPYYDLATALGTEQPFYGLQSVGIAGEEAPLKRVEEMAAHHITAIKAIQPMGPYQVGGWSFGGLVAFEIAQQLHRAGNPVSLLVLLDTPALIGDRRHIWWLKFKLFAAVVPRYIWPYINDYLTLLVSAERQRNPHVAKRTLPRLDAGQRPHKVGRVHQLMESAKLVKRAIRRPDVRQMLKVMQANSVASGGYTPSAYPNRLTLLHTESSRALFSPTDPTLGWGQLVAGGVTVQRVPGHHMNFLRHPHVGEVAATLSACLTHALVVGD